MMLRGVVDSHQTSIECFSFRLQADGAVKKISNYITRKVADKLKSLLKTVLTLKPNGMTLKSF
jgi:molecular chaperone HtpG